MKHKNFLNIYFEINFPLRWKFFLIFGKIIHKLYISWPMHYYTFFFGYSLITWNPLILQQKMFIPFWKITKFYNIYIRTENFCLQLLSRNVLPKSTRVPNHVFFDHVFPLNSKTMSIKMFVLVLNESYLNFLSFLIKFLFFFLTGSSIIAFWTKLFCVFWAKVKTSSICVFKTRIVLLLACLTFSKHSHWI